MANKAYKFRLYPTDAQKHLIAKTFGCVRFVYNQILSTCKERYELYKEDKETLKKLKFPTPAQYKPSFPWLKEVDSLSLANAQLHVQKAYKNFFAKRASFPRFKSKRAKQSYTTNVVNGNIMLFHSYIKLPKLKMVKIKQHREIPSHHKIKSCTISQSKSGKYYISILVEFEQHVTKKEVQHIAGLDFSMHDLYVASDGEKANYPRFYRHALEKLAKEQRSFSRKKVQSNRWYKQKRKIAILHERIANQRKDFLHKKSRKLATMYDAVVIEDLHMKGMSQALHFGKSVHDNGWGMFTTFLHYKLEEQGKQLVKIDKWFPSSKQCSSCGQIKESLSLSERIYHCECGLSIDRDYNASLNIKKEGMSYIS